jgi:hypothetical protein
LKPTHDYVARLVIQTALLLLHGSSGLRPTDTSHIGRIAVVLLELVPSTGSLHGDIKSVVTKRVSLYAVVSCKCWTTSCRATFWGIITGAGIVRHKDAGSLGVVGLPAFDIVVLDTGSDGAIQDNSSRTAGIALCLGMSQLVVAELNVFHARIDERPIAGIGDRVVFDLGSIGLDTVTL